MAPKYTKTIICFANSRKLSGHCVAGRETAHPHSWIRPVGSSPTGELSQRDEAFQDGRELSLLDVVEISMSEPRPHGIKQKITSSIKAITGRTNERLRGVKRKKGATGSWGPYGSMAAPLGTGGMIVFRWAALKI
jgi:hypothetical protein